MKVQMRATITGSRDGEPWPERGGYIELPDHEAQDLIAAGLAQSADSDRDLDDDVETATVAPDENAAAPGKRAPRKAAAKKPLTKENGPG